MELMPKRQLVEKTPSNSKLIVPASASSAADRAPRSRYLRAGTALFRSCFSQQNPTSIQPDPVVSQFQRSACVRSLHFHPKSAVSRSSSLSGHRRLRFERRTLRPNKQSKRQHLRQPATYGALLDSNHRQVRLLPYFETANLSIQTHRTCAIDRRHSQSASRRQHFRPVQHFL